MTRRVVSAVLVVLAALALSLAFVTGYQTGDVRRAVDELNGVQGGAAKKG